MSAGWGYGAQLVQADDTLVIYKYYCFTQTSPDYEQHIKDFDGEIYIDRNVFVGADVREKIKRMPSGRKKVIRKLIKKDVPVEELISQGKIQVKNSSGTWKTSENGVDSLVMYTLCSIFEQYQGTNMIPENVGGYA